VTNTTHRQVATGRQLLTIMCFVFSSLHPPFSRCCSCCPFTFPLVSWPVCQLGTQPLVWHINPSSQALYHRHPLSVASFCKSHHPKAPPLPPASVGTYAQCRWGLHAGTHLWPASEALGMMQSIARSWCPSRGTPCSRQLPSHTSYQHPCLWCLFRQPQLYVYCIRGVLTHQDRVVKVHHL